MTTEPIRISNSEIQTFKDCRRRWWLTYYRRLKPKMQNFTGALALGSRIHEALDQYYSSGMERDLLEIHAELIKADMKLLTDLGRDSTELESEAELGRVMLEGYLEWVELEGIDAELEMISTEEIIERPMLDGKVTLQGKIDMRVRRKIDGVRMFRDFKTVGGSFADFGSTAQMNEQVLTYMTLEEAQNQNGERSEGGIFTMLRKVKRGAYAKPPFYDQIEVRHNRFALRSFYQRLEGVLEDMMRVREGLDEGVSHLKLAYPKPSRDCKWKCQFFAICPLIDDGSAAEAAISDAFESSDPYGYYGIEEKKGSE
jgi:CRISPR/Cas system-associated exonuclease Cas4 (RecB family)